MLGQLISGVRFSEESAVLASSSIDGVIHVWSMAAILDPPEGADGEAGRSVVVDSESDHPVSEAFLVTTLRTKASRVVSIAFMARNVLIVAAEFPAS
jgi:hypothetical protein